MILLYTYDYDEYIKKRGIYYNHLEEIAPGPILYNMAELITALQNISEIEKKYKSKSIKLRKTDLISRCFYLLKTLITADVNIGGRDPIIFFNHREAFIL